MSSILWIKCIVSTKYISHSAISHVFFVLDIGAIVVIADGCIVFVEVSIAFLEVRELLAGLTDKFVDEVEVLEQGVPVDCEVGQGQLHFSLALLVLDVHFHGAQIILDQAIDLHEAYLLMIEYVFVQLVTCLHVVERIFVES